MSFRAIIRHYWPVLWKYKWSQVIILFGYGVGQIVDKAVVPVIFKFLVDTVSDPPADPATVLWKLIVYLVLALIVLNICFRLGDYTLSVSQSKMLADLSNYALVKLQDHSYTFFSNSFTGGLIAKTKRFVAAFETLHDQFWFSVWFGFIGLGSSLVVLFWFSPWLALLFFVWLVSYVVMVSFLVKHQIPKSLANAAADTKTTGHYSDIITNFFTVKMFGSRKREEKEFSETVTHQEKMRRIAWVNDGFWNNMWQGLNIDVFIVLFMAASVWLWLGGHITAGTIVLMQIYVFTSFHIVWNISKNIIRVATALTDAHEMVELFDQPIGVKDPETPEPVRMSKGEVRFDGVYFNYEGKMQVFENLDLEIRAGEKVALVGHSGAGKTTVTKLLLRFRDIESGSITIDGQNIAHVRQDDLRTKITYVPQEPLLFHRSIADNIAYAKPRATQKEIETAAKNAHAHEFIKDLPQGYDTLVGERGVKLSGGERQRVAIARAMLKDAPIIMLDEATSALDSIAEGKIQDALWKLMKGKTTIVIAHRLSTIQKMDRIIVFDAGKIVEEGSHAELLKKKGVYAKLWNSQVGGFISE